MIADMKLQNEVKTEKEDIFRTDGNYKVIKALIKEIFSENIDFCLSKEWNISIAIKQHAETGQPELTSTLKMVDRSVTGSQLSIFSDVEPELSIKLSKTGSE